MHQHLIRNIFDQYAQPENRLTHALVQVLARDEILAREFLARFVPGLKVPPKHELCFSCQRFPEQEAELPEAKLAEEEEAGGGIPDFWVYRKGDDDEPGWAVFCECKVTATLQAEQLKNHAETARKLRFQSPYLLTITPSKPESEAFRLLPPSVGACPVAWSEVYEFMEGHTDHEYIEDFLDYMHVVEGMLMTAERDFEPLTKFTGVPFGASHPYSAIEAKTILRALMRELRPRLGESGVLKVNSEVGKKAISGPWDVVRFGSSEEAFTKHPHITVGIDREECLIQLTLPDKAQTAYWKRIRACSGQQLLDAFRGVARGIGPQRPLGKGFWEPRLRVYLEQVHFWGQRDPRSDGDLEFDLNTVLYQQPQANVKPVQAWLPALCSMLTAKPRANFELGLRVRYPYVDGSVCRDAGFIDVLAKSAEALKPFLDLLTG
jgi:hypothetical protein